METGNVPMVGVYQEELSQGEIEKYLPLVQEYLERIGDQVPVKPSPMSGNDLFQSVLRAQTRLETVWRLGRGMPTLHVTIPEDEDNQWFTNAGFWWFEGIIFTAMDEGEGPFYNYALMITLWRIVLAPKYAGGAFKGGFDPEVHF